MKDRECDDEFSIRHPVGLGERLGRRPGGRVVERSSGVGTERHGDVCVVGLGGSGLAAIGALVEQGLQVVGVDAGRVAAGAAGRNGGFLLGGPATFLHSSLTTWGTSSVDLYRATLLELDRLAELLGPEVIARTGSIRLAGLPGEPVDDAEAADRVAELADCAALETVLRDNDIAVEEYDGELGRGLFLPDDAAMNPSRRALGLASLLRGGPTCTSTRLSPPWKVEG